MLLGDVLLLSSWTNETFENEICGQSTNANQISVLTNNVNVATQARFLLPDCFYLKSNPNWLSFNLNLLILQGNATYPDPLVRFATSFPKAVKFYLTRSILLYDTGAPFNIDWTDLFNTMTDLTDLRLWSTPVGTTDLPAVLPTRFTWLQIYRCGLTGTIPSTFLRDSLAVFRNLDLSGNRLTGTLASLLPSTFVNLGSLTLHLGENQLQGTLPTMFNGSSSLLTTLVVNVTSNQLTGDLSNLFAPNALANATSLSFFKVLCDNNMLTGSIPTWLNSFGAKIKYFVLSASNNRLSGTIPTDLNSRPLFNSLLQDFVYRLAGNQLTGSLPSTFFNFTLASGEPLPSPSSLELDVSRNGLSGSIPPQIFENVNFTSAIYYVFNFSSNAFTGNLPSSVVHHQDIKQLSRLLVDFSNCPSLTGTVPSTLLSSLVPGAKSTYSPPAASFYLDVSNTSVYGTFDFSSLIDRPLLTVSFSAAATKLNVLNFDNNTPLYLTSLNISNTATLAGTLPPSIFANLTTLKAASTSLSGPFPDIIALGYNTRLVSLSLSDTSIDFCSPANRAKWTSTNLRQCDLTHTNAFSCNTSYPTICTFAAPEPTTPAGCSESTRPSPYFVCIDGVWTAGTTVTAPVLTIPSGAVQTVINGNLSSSQVIVQGFGSTIIVSGCATNLTSVTVELTPEDLKKIGTSGKNQTILSMDATCNNILDQVKIVPKVTGSSCKKVSVDKISSNGSISGLFKVDSSGCNVWWIVLVSVLCGVVLIGVIVTVVVVFKVQTHKARQHSMKLHNNGNDTGKNGK